MKGISKFEGGLAKFTTGYKSFGIHINEDNSVSCKEWAPGAFKLYLYGDFSKFHWSALFIVTISPLVLL